MARKSTGSSPGSSGSAETIGKETSGAFEGSFASLQQRWPALKGRQLRNAADKFYVLFEKGQKDSVPYFKTDGTPMFLRHALNMLRKNKAVIQDSSERAQYKHFLKLRT